MDNLPRVELIPMRQAVCSDAEVILDVLVRITPPRPEVHFPRSALNLGLVLDRSGSMGGANKMPFAREAASFVVSQLLSTDRVSVTIFDNEVVTIAPAEQVTDKDGLVRRIEQIQPRGSTDLHGGWAEGCRQVASGMIDGGINRVLLLSDGLANVGVVDPNAIAAAAAGQAARGVSTTTLGVGDDYHEDLMESMARAGDGHYYFIESPVQLVDIFQSELQGLMATVGQKVSLGLEPGTGVVVSDVLNDLEKTSTGRLMLPNLVLEMPIYVLVRLKVPPTRVDATILNVRLAWNGTGADRVERRVIRQSLGGLPAVPMTAWSNLPANADVQERISLLMIARAQKEAARAAERGDIETTRRWLGEAREEAMMACPSATVQDELQAIADLEENLDAGKASVFVKLAKFRSYNRKLSRTKPSSPPPEKS